MRSLRNHLLLGIAAMLAFCATPARAQDQQSPEDRVLAAARATIEAARYCFLITLDDSGQPAGAGQPQARLMDPFSPEQDMKVWMGTNRTTRKIAQLRRNPRATLAYYDRAGVGYVTLIGKARLVDDITERKKRWKDEWKPFYPDGPAGATYILIEFTPARIEVMSARYAVASEPLAWRPAILSRKGPAWSLEK